jgi:hypothetical protein
MPPTDSMEKPATVQRTGRPIAVFSNSYARLPGAFFRTARSDACAQAPPDQVQRIARLGTGGRCTRCRTGRTGDGVCGQRLPAGRRADRDGLCRASAPARPIDGVVGPARRVQAERPLRGPVRKPVPSSLDDSVCTAILCADHPPFVEAVAGMQDGDHVSRSPQRLIRTPDRRSQRIWTGKSRNGSQSLFPSLDRVTGAAAFCRDSGI